MVHISCWRLALAAKLDPSISSLSYLYVDLDRRPSALSYHFQHNSKVIDVVNISNILHNKG